MGLTRASLIAGMITIVLAATVTSVAAQDQIGRYLIIISTIGDQTFLLDTTNGSVWQLVRFPELKTEPYGMAVYAHHKQLGRLRCLGQKVWEGYGSAAPTVSKPRD